MASSSSAIAASAPSATASSSAAPIPSAKPEVVDEEGAEAEKLAQVGEGGGVRRRWGRRAAAEAAIEAEARRLADEEAARKAAEEDARRKAEEEAERATKAADEAARLKAIEEEKAREESERLRKAAEKAAKDEAQRIAAKEKAAQEEDERIAVREKKAAEEKEAARKGSGSQGCRLRNAVKMEVEVEKKRVADKVTKTKLSRLQQHAAEEVLNAAESCYTVHAAQSREDSLQQEVRALLSNICSGDIEMIVERLALIKLGGAEELETVVRTIFLKALGEPHYCETYADLVCALRSRYPEFPPDSDSDGRPLTFTRILLNICQEDFESLDFSLESVGDEFNITGDAIRLHRSILRRKILAKMKFIGNLFLRDLLALKVIGQIVVDVIGGPKHAFQQEEILIECACELLIIVGPRLDSVAMGKMLMSGHAARLVATKQSPGPGGKPYSERIQLCIQNVLDLRANQWQKLQQPFKQQAKPEVVHEEADRAKAARRAEIQKNVAKARALQQEEAEALAVAETQTKLAEAILKRQLKKVAEARALQQEVAVAPAVEEIEKKVAEADAMPAAKASEEELRPKAEPKAEPKAAEPKEALSDRALHLTSPACPPGLEDYLPTRLTVLVFTSPVTSQTSLEMILAVIESFKFVPGLAECRLLVTCDGPGKISGALRPKKGFVTSEVAEQYKQYIEQLRSALGESCVLALPEREGFGRAVRAALERVATPYVMICQHDNLFIRPIDLCSVMRIMESNTQVLKCVHFTSPKTKFDGEAGDDVCLRRVEDRLGRVGGGARTFSAPTVGTPDSATSCMTFWPMPSWLERNHVCETAHYRNFVLGPGTRIKSGQFIEETFGQQMRQDLAAGADHDKYGVYRLIDISESATIHLDGRTYLPAQELRRRGWRESTLYARLAQQHALWLHTGNWISSVDVVLSSEPSHS